MYGRELTVRSEAEIRLGRLGKIIVHTVPVGLFVQSEDEPYFFRRIHSRFFQRLHSVKSRHYRALVVGRAPSVDFSVRDLASVRLVIPVASFRNYVKMSHDAHAFIGNVDHIALFIEYLSAELDMSAVVVRVEGGKILFLCFFQHIGKSLMDVLSKRHIIYRFGYHAGDGDKFLKGPYHLILVGVYPFVDFFPIAHKFSYRTSARSCCLLLNSFYAFDLRIAFLKHLLNDASERHHSARAACAVSLKSYFYDIVVCVFNKLDISAVSLENRSYLIKTGLDFFFHFCFFLSFVFRRALFRAQYDYTLIYRKVKVDIRKSTNPLT